MESGQQIQVDANKVLQHVCDQRNAALTEVAALRALLETYEEELTSLKAPVPVPDSDGKRP